VEPSRRFLGQKSAADSRALMPQFAVEGHPVAADAREAAERWYRDRNEIAATRFRSELDRAHGDRIQIVALRRHVDGRRIGASAEGGVEFFR
jgi:hypothetical protein